MALTLKALIEHPEKVNALKLKSSTCSHCRIPLQETITGKRPTPKGPACSDCYYDQIGDGVEQHPPVSARVRRG